MHRLRPRLSFSNRYRVRPRASARMVPSLVRVVVMRVPFSGKAEPGLASARTRMSVARPARLRMIAHLAGRSICAASRALLCIVLSPWLLRALVGSCRHQELVQDVRRDLAAERMTLDLV